MAPTNVSGRVDERPARDGLQNRRIGWVDALLIENAVPGFGAVHTAARGTLCHVSSWDWGTFFSVPLVRAKTVSKSPTDSLLRQAVDELADGKPMDKILRK
jgi:hypothetical protein